MRGGSSFQDLSPQIIIAGVESACGFDLDGVLTPYSSYVNRVFGLQDGENRRYIVKFYRPGRWSRACILEEHRFLRQCDAAEIPVVPPLTLRNGDSLGELLGVHFAVFPLRAGRLFDASAARDWLRLGSIVGRMHGVGKSEGTSERLVCSPSVTTRKYCTELAESGLVHPDCAEEFRSLCEETLETILPLFEGIEHLRIHGDCHRGNILDRAGQGLLLIDFDDMMMGPAVQDLWLLLPGHMRECRVETGLLLDGYQRFADFDLRTLRLIEPLRFMRMIYFLVWSAMQRDDFSFQRHFPDWGSKGFWIKEVEDLRYQLAAIGEHLQDESLAPG